METYFPATMRAYLAVVRQHFPAQPFASFRGYVWALAMLGTTRKGMTHIARSGVFVERHLASWARFLRGAQWDLRAVSQPLVTPWLPQLGPSGCLWEALLAAVDTTLIPNGRGQRPGVQKWPDHRGHPARGASLGGQHWALIGLVSAWGGGSLGWPVLARLLPGQLKPLGVVAAPDGVPRLDFWWVVVALVRARQPWVGERPLRVGADADLSQASFLNPLVAAGLTVISRLRTDAVGWDHPAPVVGKRPRGRPRQKGRIWQLARLLAVEPVTELTVVIYGKEERGCVVWRDVWLRDLTSTVRVVAIATKGAPLRLVSPDRTLSPAVMIQRYAARFPLERTRRDRQQ
jgi:hypothetical protein